MIPQYVCHLSKSEWLANQAIIGLTRSYTSSTEEMKHRAKLAVSVAQSMARKFTQRANSPAWGSSWAYPGEENGEHYTGLTAIEYVAGHLLTAKLRNVGCPSASVDYTVDTAIGFAEELVDKLSTAGHEPAFPDSNGKGGLTHRDRLDLEFLSQLVSHWYDDNVEPYHVVCNALHTARPLKYRQEPSGLTKGQYLYEKLSPWLAYQEDISVIRAFARKWVDILGVKAEHMVFPFAACQEHKDASINTGLSIQEWMTANIAGGMLVDLLEVSGDVVPDNLVELAVTRADYLAQVLRGNLGIDKNLSEPVFPLSIKGQRSHPLAEDYGIDIYTWLSTLILSELCRIYSGSWNTDRLRQMVDLSVAQTELFWRESLRQSES